MVHFRGYESPRHPSWMFGGRLYRLLHQQVIISDSPASLPEGGNICAPGTLSSHSIPDCRQGGNHRPSQLLMFNGLKGHDCPLALYQIYVTALFNNKKKKPGSILLMTKVTSIISARLLQSLQLPNFKRDALTSRGH